MSKNNDITSFSKENWKNLNDTITGWDDGEFQPPEHWEFDGNPALVVCHMQEGIVGRGKYGAMFTGCPADQEYAYLDAHPEIIQNQQKLLKAFRDRGLPVIFVSTCMPTHTGFIPKWGTIWNMMKSRLSGSDLDRTNIFTNQALIESVQCIPEMERRPEEPVLVHTGTTAFTATDLDAILRYHGVNELVITGFTVHSTVLLTALTAADHYFSSVVPIDSTGSPGRDEHLGVIAKKYLLPHTAMATTTEDVINHLPAKRRELMK